MTDYLIDTIAFVRYLEDRLPPRPNRIFTDAEQGRNHLLLPQIALAEFLYVALRGRLKGIRPEPQARDVLHNLLASPAFSVSTMPSSAWEEFLALKIPEMHDRMIAAEALARGVTLVSNDASFVGITRLKTVW